MSILKFEGFPTLKISEHIELPSIAELLRNPCFNMADIEDVYKNGGEINRYLLSKTPLTNTKKYVTVYTFLQYLEPKVLPVPSSDWHCDGVNSPYYSDDLFHTMMNNTSLCSTHFLENEVEVEIDDSIDVRNMRHRDFRKFIHENGDSWGFKTKEVEPNKMYSWNCRHPHKAQNPIRKEFRFFWKVCESDFHKPAPYDVARKNASVVFLGNDGQSILNIEHGQRGIIIRDRSF